MKLAIILAAPVLVVGLAGTPAFAAGCLKGAAIGGIGGHFLGHHGLIGAGVGCAIGHHEAAKHAREKARLQEQGSSTRSDTQAQSNYGR